jgi:hypothetical protein
VTTFFNQFRRAFIRDEPRTDAFGNRAVVRFPRFDRGKAFFAFVLDQSTGDDLAFDFAQERTLLVIVPNWTAFCRLEPASAPLIRN